MTPYGFFHITNRVFLYAFLIFLALVSLFPFYVMLVNATRDTVAIGQGLSIFPGDALADNYTRLVAKTAVWSGLKNSLIITSASVLLSAYFAPLAVYGFWAFDKFPGRNLVFAIVIFTLLIPAHLGIIGFFDLNVKLGLLDTFWPLILPAIANGAMIFFIKQYAEVAVSRDLLAQSRLDGAGELQIFHYIFLPLMLPAVATLSIFNFVASWNNFLSPLIIIFSKDKYTLPLIIAELRGTAFALDYGVIYLAIAFSVIPILIAFIVLSRYIIAGLSAGSVK